MSKKQKKTGTIVQKVKRKKTKPWKKEKTPFDNITFGDIQHAMRNKGMLN